MKLQIKVNPDTDTIEDVKFKTFGCGSAIASSSYLTELVSFFFAMGNEIWVVVEVDGLFNGG